MGADKRLCDETGSKNRMLLVFVAEFLGTLFFTLLPSLNNTEATNAAALALWVYFASHTSSAHLNPAITLAFVLLGHHHPNEILIYIPAQILGALTGATFTKYLIPDSVARSLGCFVPMASLNSWQVFGIEMLLTMSFIIGVFTVVFYTKDKLGFGNLGPLLIGLALFANAQAGGHYTGAALNPARVIASPIIIGCQGSNYIHSYILGELAGALGAFVVTFVFFGINADSWYVRWLKEDQQHIVPAFNYSLKHENAQTDLRTAKARGRTPSMHARGLRDTPNMTTPESHLLIPPPPDTAPRVAFPTPISIPGVPG